MEILTASTYVELCNMENCVVQRVRYIEMYNTGNCIIQSTTTNVEIYNPIIQTVYPVSQHRELSIVLI